MSFFQSERKTEIHNQQNGAINIQSHRQTTTNIYAGNVEIKDGTAHVERVVHRITSEEIAAFSLKCWAAADAAGSLAGGFIAGIVRELLPVVQMTAKGIVDLSIYSAKGVVSVAAKAAEKRRELAAKAETEYAEYELVEGVFTPSIQSDEDRLTAVILSADKTANENDVRKFVRMQLQIEQNETINSLNKTADYVTATCTNRAMSNYSICH